jgi:hypothetical protein
VQRLCHGLAVWQSSRVRQENRYVAFVSRSRSSSSASRLGRTEQTNLTHRIAVSLALLLVATTLGCASVGCRPETIVVAKKEERARLDTGPGPIVTTEAGRVAEEVRPTIVREYWVESDRGVWYPVAADRYRLLEVGRAARICR